MKYISLCDGIGAAHVAWQALGWKCLAVAEIDPYCNAVVGHHFGFPNLGDITKLTKERILEYGKPDLIIGGTPCQSFSCAGKREGTASPDGQLIYTFVDIVQAIKPRWIIWENVYGVLSADNGAAFASFVHYLAQCGYGLAWRVLDAQFFGVPQRRRRVFLVGCLGNPAGAGKVLFESQGMPWDPPPSGSAREIDPRTIANCLREEGETKIACTLTKSCRQPEADACQNLVTFTLRRRNESGLRVGIDNMVVDTMTRKWAKGSGGPAGDECQNLAAVPIAEVGKRTGHSTRNPSNGIGIGKDGDPMHTLQASARHAVACTLTASDGGPNDYTPIIADTLTKNWIRSKGAKAGNNAGLVNPIAGEDLDVRRLTPTECCRLQGFPDDYTLVPVKTYKNGRVESMSDTQQYVTLGNSMAVPVIEWIGRRLETVHHRTYGGSMPKKTTKKAAKTATLEVPITLQNLPDEILVQQWNAECPAGTEVLFFDDNITADMLLKNEIDPYQCRPVLTKTIGTAVIEQFPSGRHYKKGPIIVLENQGLFSSGAVEEPVLLREHVVPAGCLPKRFKKYIDDQKCLEIMGVGRKAKVAGPPEKKKTDKKTTKTK